MFSVGAVQLFANGSLASACLRFTDKEGNDQPVVHLLARAVAPSFSSDQLCSDQLSCDVFRDQFGTNRGVAVLAGGQTMQQQHGNKTAGATIFGFPILSFLLIYNHYENGYKLICNMLELAD